MVERKEERKIMNNEDKEMKVRKKKSQNKREERK